MGSCALASKRKKPRTGAASERGPPPQSVSKKKNAHQSASGVSMGERSCKSGKAQGNLKTKKKRQGIVVDVEKKGPW